jgi:hypothetical protein
VSPKLSCQTPCLAPSIPTPVPPAATAPPVDEAPVGRGSLSPGPPTLLLGAAQVALDWISFDVEIARDVEPLCPGVDEHSKRREAFHRMMNGEGGLSVAVTWDSRTKDWEVYDESCVVELGERLESFPVVAAFNHGFDISVVEALCKRKLNLPCVVDPLMYVRGENGRFVKGSRLSLLAEWNCNFPPKNGSGKDAYALWDSGQIAKLIRNCRGDVERLCDLIRFIRDNSFILGPDGRIDLDLPTWFKELA